MLGGKKKALSRANKVLTATSLLKAALAQDNETMVDIVTGQTADDEGIWFALETFIGVAHRHPEIQIRLAELQQQMPQNAQVAYSSAISAAKANLPRLFQGGSVAGQGMLIMGLTAAISENKPALEDAMSVLRRLTRS